MIIALTMYMTKIYIVEAILTGSFLFEMNDLYKLPEGYESNFVLLVLMMVFLAAGGNIINDYFDVRADRINKPNKTYIDYHISRKTAIITHLTFTFLAIFISVYLWFATDNYYFFLMAISIASLLWFYSSVLKRKFLIGNFIVALLTGFVPIVSYLYFGDVINQFEFTSLDYTMGTMTIKLLPKTDIIVFVGVFSLMAFLLNIIREIIKDICDIVGDARVGVRTMPIVLGVSATKIILSLMIIFLISIFSFPFMMWPKSAGIKELFIPFMVMTGLMVLTMFFLIMAREKGKYKYASFTLKLAMLFGLFLPAIINSGINEF